MSYTRISDNMRDSSLYSDDSYVGVCTYKAFEAILFEVRRTAGRIERLTPAKLARIAVIPFSLADAVLVILTGVDPRDSSGVAEGRRLIPDPDGGPNDFIVTNWEAYGRKFAQEDKAARQRRWREKKRQKNAEVDATVYAQSTGRRDVDAGETQRETQDREEREVLQSQKQIGDLRRRRSRKLIDDPIIAAAFDEDLRLVRTVAKAARAATCQQHYLAAVRNLGLDEVRLRIRRGVENYGAELRRDQQSFPRSPKEDSTLVSNVLKGDYQKAVTQPAAQALPASGRPLEGVPL